MYGLEQYLSNLLSLQSTSLPQRGKGRDRGLRPSLPIGFLSLSSPCRLSALREGQLRGGGPRLLHGLDLGTHGVVGLALASSVYPVYVSYLSREGGSRGVTSTG